jgi:hypothetical protein
MSFTSKIKNCGIYSLQGFLFLFSITELFRLKFQNDVPNLLLLIVMHSIRNNIHFVLSYCKSCLRCFCWKALTPYLSPLTKYRKSLASLSFFCTYCPLLWAINLFRCHRIKDGQEGLITFIRQGSESSHKKQQTLAGQDMSPNEDNYL